MRKFIYALTAGVFLGAFGLAGVGAYESSQKAKWEAAEVITLDGGGSVFEYIDKYNRWRAEGKFVRIEGVCVSACTFFLGLLDPEKVCVSDKALLGFHGVYIPNFATMRYEFDLDFSLWIKNYIYPKTVTDFLETKGFDFTQDVVWKPGEIGLIWGKGADFGYQTCEDVV